MTSVRSRLYDESRRRATQTPVPKDGKGPKVLGGTCRGARTGLLGVLVPVF